MPDCSYLSMSGQHCYETPTRKTNFCVGLEKSCAARGYVYPYTRTLTVRAFSYRAIDNNLLDEEAGV